MVASEVSDHNFFSEADLPGSHGCPNLFLSNYWSRHVKSALLHVISLARLACVHTWGWAAGSLDPRTRLAAQLQQARAARPQTLVTGRPGVRIELAVDFEGGPKHLPVVALRRVA
jgi:hypothetical protein